MPQAHKLWGGPLAAYPRCAVLDVSEDGSRGTRADRGSAPQLPLHVHAGAPSSDRIVAMNAPSRLGELVSRLISSGREQRTSLPLCSSPTRLNRSASSIYAVDMKIVIPSFRS